MVEVGILVLVFSFLVLLVLPSGDTPRSWFTGVEDWFDWAELKQECLARLGHQVTVGKELSTYRRRNHSVKGVEQPRLSHLYRVGCVVNT